MTQIEARVSFEELFSRLRAGIPSPLGSPSLEIACRVYFSCNNLVETSEFIPKVSTTMWSEINIRPASCNTESLHYYFSLSIQKNGKIKLTDEELQAELDRFYESILNELFSRIAEAESCEEIDSICASKLEADKAQDLEKYNKEIKAFYKKVMIFSITALIVIIPLAIIVFKKIFIG